MLPKQQQNQVDGHDTTSKRRSCARNHILRNVWCASVLDQFLPSLCMCKIYMKTHMFTGACPPKHCVRNVSRASSFPLAGHPRGSLDHSLGHLGPPSQPKGFRSLPPGERFCLNFVSPRSQLHPDIPSCILCRRERHAHEVS